MNNTTGENFNITLYGYSGEAVNRDWANTGMALMNKMFKEVAAHGLATNGTVVWGYWQGNMMMAGVELPGSLPGGTDLEQRSFELPRYVRIKHIGPYNQIPETFTKAQEYFKNEGIAVGLPYLELYGHWNEDPSKLETDLLWTLV
jgi:effector-binding domain-containing protein